MDTFIEVNIANNVGESDVTTLHHFNEMDAHFSSFLRGQSGLQYDITPSQSDPTLVMSRKTAFFGTQLDEYTITTMYIVRKIHASNRIPQASQSDLELILEHSRNGDNNNTNNNTNNTNSNRLFLCAIISPENAMDPTEDENEDPTNTSTTSTSTTSKTPINYSEMKGYDPSFVEFVSKIDTSSKSSAQFRINNGRKLPTPISLTFPGMTECLEYTDSEKNIVLLASTPLLIPETILQSIAAQISPGAAPVFTNFDFIPDSSAQVRRGKFLSNRVSTGLSADPFKEAALDAEEPSTEDTTTDGFTSDIGARQTTKKRRVKSANSTSTNSKSAGKEESTTTTTAATTPEEKDPIRKCKTKTSPASDAIFALNTLTVAMVTIPLCIVIWIYFPYIYSDGLKYFGEFKNGRLEQPNLAVWGTRWFFIVYFGISLALIITGASIRQWVMMIVGLVLIVLWITAIITVQFNLNSKTGIIINEEMFKPFKTAIFASGIYK